MEISSASCDKDDGKGNEGNADDCAIVSAASGVILSIDCNALRVFKLAGDLSRLLR